MGLLGPDRRAWAGDGRGGTWRWQVGGVDVQHLAGTLWQAVPPVLVRVECGELGMFVRTKIQGPVVWAGTEKLRKPAPLASRLVIVLLVMVLLINGLVSW